MRRNGTHMQGGGGGGGHKINVVLWNYWLEREKKGYQRTKKQRGMADFYSIIKKRSERSDEEGVKTQWSVNKGNEKKKYIKLCLLLFICAVFIYYAPTHQPNPAFYRHHLNGCHHHLFILLPPTLTPLNMIAATTNATVYDRHHHIRI